MINPACQAGFILLVTSRFLTMFLFMAVFINKAHLFPRPHLGPIMKIADNFFVHHE